MMSPWRGSPFSTWLTLAIWETGAPSVLADVLFSARNLDFYVKPFIFKVGD